MQIILTFLVFLVNLIFLFLKGQSCTFCKYEKDDDDHDTFFFFIISVLPLQVTETILVHWAL